MRRLLVGTLLCGFLAVFGIAVFGVPSEVAQLVIDDPSQSHPGCYAVGIDLATPGRLIFEVSNPDVSRDGTFRAMLEAVFERQLVLMTSVKPHTSGPDGVNQTPPADAAGLAANRVELFVGAGAHDLCLGYSSLGGLDNTGPDTITAYFEPTPLIFSGDDLLASFTVGPTEAASASFLVEGPAYIIQDVTQVGTSGEGWFSLYLDGIPLVTTHMINNSPSLPRTTPHTLALLLGEARVYEFTIMHEDSLWGDNTGTRTADIYVVGIPSEPITEEDTAEPRPCLTLVSLEQDGGTASARIRNSGNLACCGEASAFVGLSYCTSWVPEWCTIFQEASFGDVCLLPGEEIVFKLDLAVVPEECREAFAEQLDLWWTGYEDPDPEDYLGFLFSIGTEHCCGFIPDKA